MDKSKLASFQSLFVIIALLGALDYLTGYDLGFFVFYHIPIALAAWYRPRRWAISTALVCAVVWGVIDFICEHPYSNDLFYYWNTFVRLASFLAIALAISKLQQLYKEQVRLVGKLKIAMEEMKQLKGFIPICASCKKIRNDKGFWEQIEKYISEHTKAEFSHGICPDCAHRLYPQIWDELHKEDLLKATPL